MTLPLTFESSIRAETRPTQDRLCLSLYSLSIAPACRTDFCCKSCSLEALTFTTATLLSIPKLNLRFEATQFTAMASRANGKARALISQNESAAVRIYRQVLDKEKWRSLKNETAPTPYGRPV